MSRVILSLQETLRTGLEVTYASADAANDHSFDNRGQNVLLHVKNGGGGAVQVTIDTPGTIDGLAIPNQVVSIPAGEERFFGPFRNDLYGQGDQTLTRAVLVDLDIDTSVTIAAISIGDVNF